MSLFEHHERPEYQWITEASCLELPLERLNEFFPKSGSAKVGLPGDLLKMCQACPVRLECLNFSYDQQPGTADKHGYYAGVSQRYRRTNSQEMAEAAVKRGDV